MLPLHTLLYLLIIAVVFFAEVSNKVNTDSLGKKTGLCLILIGALLELAHVHTQLLPLGVLIYFGRNILVSYFNYKKRRVSDGNNSRAN